MYKAFIQNKEVGRTDTNSQNMMSLHLNFSVKMVRWRIFAHI